MITLEVTPQTEDRVRKIANRFGKPITDYLVDLIEQHIATVETTTLTEEELLQQINLGLSEEEWKEYSALLQKQDAQTLEHEEHERIAEIAEFLELSNARRIQALVQLAEMRNTTLDNLMSEFDIRPANYQNVST